MPTINSSFPTTSCSSSIRYELNLSNLPFFILNNHNSVYEYNFLVLLQLAAETSVLNDTSTAGSNTATPTPAPAASQRFGSFPNTNLQNLESQLNSIYNSTNTAEFAANTSRTPGTGHHYNSHCATRQNSCFGFSNATQQRKSYNTERQRSQSLPHTNTRDPYVTLSNNSAHYNAANNNNNFKQAPNSRLPNYNNANASVAAANAQNYPSNNAQYQFTGHNERLVDQNMYDNSQYTCNQMAAAASGYNNYDNTYNQTNTMSNQTPSQPGLPSPAPGTTAPVPSCFGHQHLPTARHCNCNSQQCNAHYYNESAATGDNAKMPENWQCNQAAGAMNNVQNYQANYMADQYGQNVQSEGDYNAYNNSNANDNRMNFNPATAAANAQNYNCNHAQMNMKYTQAQYQQQQQQQQQQSYQQQQNHQFYQNDQQHQQQQFKPQLGSDNTQSIQANMNRPQQTQVRSETELQCNVVSQSSLNMRPAAYERTLQYVEQCQMFNVTSTTTTNQNESSNMVINDMTTSLNSLLEENKYLQMSQMM